MIQGLQGNPPPWSWRHGRRRRPFTPPREPRAIRPVCLDGGGPCRIGFGGVARGAGGGGGGDGGGGGGVAVSASGGGAGRRAASARPRDDDQVALARRSLRPGPRRAPDREPPSLTASDGSGLSSSRSASAAVDTPLASSTSSSGTRAARAQGTFPRGSAEIPVALRDGSTLPGGRVVESSGAARVKTSSTAGRIGAARRGHGQPLLRAGVPDPGEGAQEIVIAYASRVGSSDPYRLALRGLRRSSTSKRTSRSADAPTSPTASTRRASDRARPRPAGRPSPRPRPARSRRRGARPRSGAPRGGATSPFARSALRRRRAARRARGHSASRALDSATWRRPRGRCSLGSAEVPVTDGVRPGRRAPLRRRGRGNLATPTSRRCSRGRRSASDLGYALDHTRRARAATAGPGVVAARRACSS